MLSVVNYCSCSREETASESQVSVIQKLASEHQLCGQKESETFSEIIQDSYVINGSCAA